MKPTYQQLEDLCGRQEKQIVQQAQRIKELESLLKQALGRIVVLEEQVSVLTERLGKNSKNSSKPPSTDRKRNTPLQKSRNRKPREGKARPLLPLDQVNHHKICQLQECPECGSSDLLLKRRRLIQQQVELPEGKGITTQFDRHKYRCRSCKSSVVAPLPQGTPDSAFGPRLMAFVANLTGIFHLAKDDVRLLIKDLYDIDISDGSVINIEERVAKALAPTYEGICQFVTESDRCKHFDETSWRDSGQSHYVWIACTKEAVSYRIDRHRSRAAFMAIADNLNPSAPVVTDRYGAYSSLKNPHQYCISHLIRDFRRYSQRDGPDGIVGLSIEKELQKVCHIHGLYRDRAF